MRDIRERSADYALRAIQLYRHLLRKRDGVGAVLGKQYLRSATSIGANLIEAQAGESRRDFIHKCSIAQKEARESKYWLQLMLRAELIPPARVVAAARPGIPGAMASPCPCVQDGRRGMA